MVSVLKHPTAVAIGCGLSLTLLALDTASGDANLRTGLVPIGLGLLSASCALSFAQAAWHGAGLPRRLSRVSSTVAAAALCILAGFFFSMAVLYAAGSALLDNSEGPAALLGTAVASVTSLLILPAAVLVFSLGMLRDRRYPKWVRALPWTALVVLTGGMAVVAALPESQEGWFLLSVLGVLALLVSSLAFGVSNGADSRVGHVAELAAG